MIDFISKVFDILWKVITFIPLTIWKIITDTLQSRGKWSIKRFAGISGFFISVVYALVPIFYPAFQVHEFVFWGFITFGATALGMTVWNKKIDKANTTEDN
ncbi:MAG: hypothetical protein ACI9JN_001291 [Bacteroidia bacterium]|jgi:hypothetical protein